MVKQTDPNFNNAIRFYGCNFMSHLYLVRQDWTLLEVAAVYQKAVKAKAMGSNCDVQNPNLLIQLAGGSMRQIGGQELVGKKGSWGATLPHKQIKFAIVRWSQKNSRHLHFTVYCVKDGGELYDPYCPVQATYRLEKDIQISEQYYG